MSEAHPQVIGDRPPKGAGDHVAAGASPRESDVRAGRSRSGTQLARARAGLAVLGPVAVLAVWWWVAQSASPLTIPQPVDVARRTVDLMFTAESTHTWTSMVRILVAVVLALAIGSGLVFLARLVPVTESLVTKALLPFLNSVPALGWAILGVIWFGVGNSAVIVVVTLILIPFCMVNMWEGMRNLDTGLQEMARSFTRSRTKMLFRIQVPLLMPYVLAAIRLSFSVGWKVALIAEFFGAQSGLGLVMNRARQSFDTPTVFATIVVVLVIVTVVERLVFDPVSQMFARRSGGGAA
ncbi:ABC transporter permease [Georgenia yuyongxinii]|uniref:ABC transporter permease subunit n=1 Tax=Georgenia yuyongxinii TaxID=2589797 RepID=A0A552WSL4_9MICO|nr:ABC transporter permease subunit [Georgenia yuyongxinii]TRW45830.1 ABC transporter permease subunit [Georgenia yuyongxinii]